MSPGRLSRRPAPGLVALVLAAQVALCACGADSTITLAPGATLPTGRHSLALSVSGQPRAAELYVPARTGPWPVVILLHGDDDTSADFLRRTDAVAAAERAGVVLVAPQGILRSFFVTRLDLRLDYASWDPYQSIAEGNLDLPLLAELRRLLGAAPDVDRSRLSVMGYSRGGQLAFREGLEQAADYACVGMASAWDPDPSTPLVAEAARPLPFTLQLGALDPRLDAGRATRLELEAAAHPLRYVEVPGAEHGPFPGDLGAWLTYCAGMTR